MLTLPIATDRLLLRGDLRRVAIEHDGDEVGEISIDFGGTDSHAEVAFSIVPNAQRRRFAGEALGAVVDALFAHTALNGSLRWSMT